MTIERQMFEEPRRKRQRISKAVQFRTQIEGLEPAPEGMEYKRFYGQPVLFPKTGSDQIRIGTGYTERQLQFAIDLQDRRNSDPDVLHRISTIRDRRLG